MGSRMKVLGVAPYEGMQSLMYKVAEEFPDIELSVFLGDLAAGVAVVQERMQENYDIVISRGGTAGLLRQQISIPVVEISFTVYDILPVLRLADVFHGQIAVVGFPSVTDAAGTLQSIVSRSFDIFPITGSEQTQSVLETVRAQQYGVILCDTISYTVAQRMGLNAILITSGRESIRMAFENAANMFHAQERLREENRFYRLLLSQQPSEIAVFGPDKTLRYSSAGISPDSGVMELLQRELDDDKSQPRYLVKTRNAMQYNIKCVELGLPPDALTAFFFTQEQARSAKGEIAIRYYNAREAEDAFYASFQGACALTGNLQSEIQRVNQTRSHLMLLSERGCGSEDLAKYIYFTSERRKRPLALIDCGKINVKGWNYLVSSLNSPLYALQNTIVFYRADTLKSTQQQELQSALSDLQLCARCRIVFTCETAQDGSCPPACQDLIERCSCAIVRIPPLRECRQRIAQFVNLYLSRLKLNTGSDVCEIEPEALACLQEFSWPGNYAQLKRIITQAATLTSGTVLRKAAVVSVLSAEYRCGMDFARPDETPLNLNQPLNTIKKDIVQLILNQEHGNQSAAAARLGISRATLWRLTKEA